MNAVGREARDQDLVAPLDDHARHGRAHVRRAQRRKFIPVFVTREHGRPQARRVLADADVPRPLGRPQGQGRRRCRGRPRRRAEVTAMEARAGKRALRAVRVVRMPPQKARLVVDLIRGKRVEEALGDPRVHARSAARSRRRRRCARRSPTPRTRSNVDVDALYVKRAFVDEGPTRKRFLPRAHGRATPILKRTSHITVVVDERSAGGEAERDGTEGTSEGLPARRHRDLGLALVRAARLRRAPARGHQDPQVPEEAPLPRGHLQDRDRARRQQGEDQHPHRAARHRDRQEGRRDREAQAGARQAHRQGDASSTSTRCGGPTSTRSSSPRTSRCSSSAASRSAAR